MQFFPSLGSGVIRYQLKGVELHYLIYFIPAIIIALIALIWLKKVFSKGYKVKSKNNMTGADAANLLLEQKDCEFIAVNCTKGREHAKYNFSTRTVDLSTQTYYNTAITSIAIAALEANNAHRALGELFLRLIRYIINPVIQLSAAFALPAIVIALIVQSGSAVNVGMLLFSLAVLLSVLLIPYELIGASGAYKSMKSCGVLLPYELKLLKKVMFVSSLSYVASTFTALWSIIKAVLGKLGK